ncbi:unnamed protein product [Effrenium voratum]|nr:unnamed protein product [Effrenium voratum]
MPIDERSKRFTPAVSSSFCMARVWKGGLGGQCPMLPSSLGLCKVHAEREAAEGLPHGRVDGPIPAEKLREFEKQAEKSGSPLRSPPRSPSPKARERRSPQAPQRTPQRTPRTPAAASPRSGSRTPVRGDGSRGDGDPSRCLARVWAEGKGGQCQKPAEEGGLCKQHVTDASKHKGVPCHGFVDGEIPAAKLEAFRKAAEKNGWDKPSPGAPSAALPDSTPKPAAASPKRTASLQAVLKRPAMRRT